MFFLTIKKEVIAAAARQNITAPTAGSIYRIPTEVRSDNIPFFIVIFIIMYMGTSAAAVTSSLFDTARPFGTSLNANDRIAIIIVSKVI